MIVLDTNVISELMRPAPQPAVLAWVAGQPRSSLCTTLFCQAELLYGVAALPAGKRRTALAEATERLFAEDFAGRVLAFSATAAALYADIVVARRQAGRPIEVLDALIAATALAAGADVATRDTGGFEGCGLKTINPWVATT